MKKYISDEDAAGLIDFLSARFPFADQVVIGVMVDALATHNAKHHDYNGKRNFSETTGLKGRFLEVWRKSTRLFVMIWDQEVPLVDESSEESALDLVVFAAMLTSAIRKEKNK